MLLLTISNGRVHLVLYSDHTSKSISRDLIFKIRSERWQPNQKPTIGHLNTMKRFICKIFFWFLQIFRFDPKHVFHFSAFNTASEDQLDFYELHICIRDYCFAREDRLVGVAVLQLKDIVDQVSRVDGTLVDEIHEKTLRYNFSVHVPDGFHCSKVYQKTRQVGRSYVSCGSEVMTRWRKSLSSSNPKFDRSQHKKNKMSNNTRRRRKRRNWGS